MALLRAPPGPSSGRQKQQRRRGKARCDLDSPWGFYYLAPALNLPNALTLLRMFLVPLLVVVLLTRVEGHVYLGAAIFGVAVLTDYLDGLTTSATAAGGIALGAYDVQGTMIGDGRDWDEAHLWWFADQADLDALLADSDLGDLTAARDNALTDHYQLILDGVQVEPLGREP